jgi:hypothetical protein
MAMYFEVTSIRRLPFGRWPGGVPSTPGVRTIRGTWARAVFLSAGAAACLAGCIAGAPIPPTYSQDELKAICERNGGHWQLDELTGGFCRMNSGKS